MAAVRRRERVTPPLDYQEYVAVVGPGELQSSLGVLWIFDPGADFLRSSVYFDEGLRVLAATPEQGNPPWPLFPVEGGFLPWGSTDPEYPVGWLTDGNPESWTTAFYYGSASDVATWDLGFVDFLFEWCSGTFHSGEAVRWGPAPGERPRFRPFAG